MAVFWLCCHKRGRGGVNRRTGIQVRGLLSTFEERFAEAVAEEEQARAAEAAEAVRRRKQEEDDEVLRRMRETMGAPSD